MNKKLLTATALTVLLSSQVALANNDAEEFLSWLDGQDTVQVTEFNTVSFRNDNSSEDSYKAENDIFSIDYMNDK